MLKKHIKLCFLLSVTSLQLLARDPVIINSALVRAADGFIDMGMIVFVGKKIVDLRRNLNSNHTALDKAKEEFSKVIESYDSQIYYYRVGLLSVISEWGAQVGCPDTLLLDWVAMGREKFLVRKITSIGILNKLLEDLLYMLSDIKKTCVKSRKNFEQKFNKK